MTRLKITLIRAVKKTVTVKEPARTLRAKKMKEKALAEKERQKEKAEIYKNAAAKAKRKKAVKNVKKSVDKGRG